MTNALDYIAWRGDLTFERDPINEVDMFLFSQLATPDYSGIIGLNDEMPLKDVMRRYFELHSDDWKELGLLQSKSVIPMMKKMAESERFGNILLASQKQIIKLQKMEQFEATSIIPTKDRIIISFRGTDDTLVGWKEDMYLALVDEVAAQRDALKYLTKIAAWYPDKKICLVGHSKGGNLAIFAAVNAPEAIRDRIELAVGFDSPGFSDKFVKSENYQTMKDRIITVISQHSIVGVLMNLTGRFCLVHSYVAGPYAHDGFNWGVVGTHFERGADLSNFSISLSIAIYDTLAKMDDAHKKEFVEELFNILGQNGALTVTDISGQKLKEKTALLGQLLTNKTMRRFGVKIAQEMDKAHKNMEGIRAGLSEYHVNIDTVMQSEKA